MYDIYIFLYKFWIKDTNKVSFHNIIRYKSLCKVVHHRIQT